MHIDEIIWPSVGASATRRGACISTSRTPPIMQFNDQSRYCHPERSEGSLCPSRETFRSAQDDKTFPILLVKNHYRPPNRHQPKKSPSNSVGARVVEWGREGLDGRPRPVPCAHLWGQRAHTTTERPQGSLWSLRRFMSGCHTHDGA